MANKTILYIIIVIALLVISNIVSYRSGKKYMDDYCVDPATANDVVDLANEMIDEVNDCRNSNIQPLPNFNE